MPKIIDFGIAKVLTEEDSVEETLTKFGQIVGTPQYMSPEQASFDSELIDTRADIYSLGAVLYELVTGRPPIKADTVVDTLKKIAIEQPVAPTRIDRHVGADLETICMKCLEKKPDERFSSPLELAEELRRFLENRPIKSRPIGRLTRIRKWAKRSPWAASLVAVSCLALVGLISLWAILTWQLAEEKSFAIANFNRAHLAVKKYLETLQSHTPLGSSENLIFQKQFLKTGIEFYDDLLMQSGNSLRASSEQLSDVKLERANMYIEYAKVSHALYDYSEALEAYQTAINMCQDVRENWPEHKNKATRTLGVTLLSRAKTLRVLQRFPEAIESCQQSIAHYQELKSDLDGGYFYWYQALAWNRIGAIRVDQKENELALQAFDQAIECGKKLSTVFDFQLTRSKSHLEKGKLLRRFGRLDEAWAECEFSRSTIARVCVQCVPSLPRYDAALANSLKEMARCSIELGDQQRALKFIDQALQMQNSLAKSNPQVEQFSIDLIDLYEFKAEFAPSTDASNALKESERLRDELARIANDPDKLFVRALMLLKAARKERLKYRYQSHERFLAQALMLLEKLPLNGNQKVKQTLAGVHHELAFAHYELLNYSDAKKHADLYNEIMSTPSQGLDVIRAVSMAKAGDVSAAKREIEKQKLTPERFDASRIFLIRLLDAIQVQPFDDEKFTQVVEDLQAHLANRKLENKLADRYLTHDLCRAVIALEKSPLPTECFEEFVVWAKATAIESLGNVDIEKNSFQARQLPDDPRLKPIRNEAEFKVLCEKLNSIH